MTRTSVLSPQTGEFNYMKLYESYYMIGMAFQRHSGMAFQRRFFGWYGVSAYRNYLLLKKKFCFFACLAACMVFQRG